MLLWKAVLFHEERKGSEKAKYNLILCFHHALTDATTIMTLVNKFFKHLSHIAAHNGDYNNIETFQKTLNEEINSTKRNTEMPKPIEYYQSQLAYERYNINSLQPHPLDGHVENIINFITFTLKHSAVTQSITRSSSNLNENKLIGDDDDHNEGEERGEINDAEYYRRRLKRKVKIDVLKLTKEETNTLINNCRSNGTTITALLIALEMIALYTTLIKKHGNTSGLQYS